MSGTIPELPTLYTLKSWALGTSRRMRFITIYTQEGAEFSVTLSRAECQQLAETLLRLASRNAGS